MKCHIVSYELLETLYKQFNCEPSVSLILQDVWSLIQIEWLENKHRDFFASKFLGSSAGSNPPRPVSQAGHYQLGHGNQNLHRLK